MSTNCLKKRVTFDCDAIAEIKPNGAGLRITLDGVPIINIVNALTIRDIDRIVAREMRMVLDAEYTIPEAESVEVKS